MTKATDGNRGTNFKGDAFVRVIWPDTAWKTEWVSVKLLERKDKTTVALTRNEYFAMSAPSLQKRGEQWYFRNVPVTVEEVKHDSVQGRRFKDYHKPKVVELRATTEPAVNT